MSTENSVLRLSFEAAEDLSDYQYHFVTIDSSNKIQLLNAANDIAVGVLQDTPESGQAGNVMLIGKSKIKANAALTVGTWVAPEYVSTTDCGKAMDAGLNWESARGYIMEASAAEDDIASIMLAGPFPPGVGLYAQVPVSNGLVTATASAATLTATAAQLLGGTINATPTEAQALTLPTAALLIAAIKQAGVGNQFDFWIRNLSAYTITVGAGADGTLDGTATIATANSKQFRVVITSATTYTVYSMGTFVH